MTQRVLEMSYRCRNKRVRRTLDCVMRRGAGANGVRTDAGSGIR